MVNAGHDKMVKQHLGAAFPLSEAEVLSAAKSIGLPFADACLPGVVANLALLRWHAEVLAAGEQWLAR